MRIVVPIVIEMTDEQVAEYATEYGLPRKGGRLTAKEVVDDVRSHVLTGIQDSHRLRRGRGHREHQEVGGAPMSDRTPLVKADIADPAHHQGAAVSYASGFNTSGTNQHEVIQVVNRPDGSVGNFVIMRGLSRAKTEAVVMILNAPEA